MAAKTAVDSIVPTLASVLGRTGMDDTYSVGTFSHRPSCVCVVWIATTPNQCSDLGLLTLPLYVHSPFSFCFAVCK